MIDQTILHYKILEKLGEGGMSVRNKGTKFFILAFILLTGCRTTPRLSTDDIRNAVYNVPEVGNITFVDGSYDRKANDSLKQSYLHIGLVDLFAFGDLNGDGSEDAVTFLAQNAGGSGIFLSLEVLLNHNGLPLHTASFVIGDRVAIDSVKIVQETINLYLITQGPGDAMCCPTMHVSRKLHLQNGELVGLAKP